MLARFNRPNRYRPHPTSIPMLEQLQGCLTQHLRIIHQTTCATDLELKSIKGISESLKGELTGTSVCAHRESLDICSYAKRSTNNLDTAFKKSLWDSEMKPDFNSVSQNNQRPASKNHQRDHRLLGRCKSLGNFIPIDDLPKSGDVIRTTVLILQIISVLPNIETQNRSTA